MFQGFEPVWPIRISGTFWPNAEGLNFDNGDPYVEIRLSPNTNSYLQSGTGVNGFGSTGAVGGSGYYNVNVPIDITFVADFLTLPINNPGFDDLAIHLIQKTL